MKKMLNELVRYGKFAFALAFALCCFSASASVGTFAKKVDFTFGSTTANSNGATDVPVLVKLAENSPSGFSYSDCANGGSDIRFADASGNALPFEIDSWNTEGESTIWVKAPAVASGTTITMYYKGTPSSVNTPSDVWSGYTGVWHFETLDITSPVEYSQGKYANSTATAGIDGNLSSESVSGTDGKFGKSFKATTVAITSSNYNTTGGGVWVSDSGTSSPLDADGVFTISGWFKFDGAAYYWNKLFMKREKADTGTGGFSSQMNGDLSQVQVKGDSSSTANSFSVGDTKDPQSDWVYFTLVYNDTTLKCYANGALQKDCTVIKASDNDFALTFGNVSSIENGGTPDCPWDGRIDEVRYSKVAMTDNQIAAEYAAMANPSFLSAGAVENVDVPTPGPITGDYYVSTTGSDSNAGTSREAPLLTIAAAVTKVGSATDKTIVVLEGTYEIDSTISLNNGTKLIGEGMNKTTIKPASGQNIRCVELNGGAKLEGVTLTGGNVSTGAGAGVLINDGTVSWCCISNNTATAGNTSGGGVSFTDGKGVIDHSIVTGNKVGTVGGSWGAGIGGLNLVGPVLIDACLVYGNDNPNGSGGGIGFDMLGKALTIRNCTIVKNKGKFNSGGLYYNQATVDVLLLNNIVVGNTKDGSVGNMMNGSYLDSASRNCLFETATEAGYVTGSSYSSDLSAIFVDASNGNYKLASSSPAKGAGLAGSGSGVDLDNKAFAATPSIGCYEANPAAAAREWTARPMRASGDTIRNDGTLVYAYGRIPTNNAEGQWTVNDVVFECSKLYDESDFSTRQSNVAFSPVFNGWQGDFDNEGLSTDYGSLLNNGFKCNATGYNNMLLTLNNLTAGKRYLVQLISHKHDDALTVSAGGVTAQAGGTGWTYGGSLECEFTAVATSESFALSCAGGMFVMNAIQVRELSDAPTPTGADYYVSTDGSDSNNGRSRTSAFATIAHAVSEASGAGEVICVLPGVYTVVAPDNDSSAAIVIDKAVTICGDTGNPDDVVIRNTAGNEVTRTSGLGAYRVFLINHADAVVSGITVEGGKLGGGDFGGGNIRIGANGGTVTNCIVRNAIAYGYSGTASKTRCSGAGIYAENGLITHCVITNNFLTRNGTCAFGNLYNVGGCAGVHIIGGVLRESLIAYNETTKDNMGAAVYIAGNGTLMENCTVAANRSVGQEGSFYPILFYPNATEANNPIVRNTLIINGSAAAGTPGLFAEEWLTQYSAGLATAGKRFVNCATDYVVPDSGFDSLITTGITLTRDFRPTTGSSVIDAGTEMSSPVALDLAGNPRVGGTDVDIGCYEYDSATPEPMFFVGALGYTTWADAYAAVSDGGTIKAGANATISGLVGKRITIDLNGWTVETVNGVWMSGEITIVDNGEPAGRIVFLDNGTNINQSHLDLSALDSSQISGKLGLQTGVTEVKFPSDMSYEAALQHISYSTMPNYDPEGTTLVIQGVTYTWDGTAWVAQTTPEGDWFVSPSGNDISNDGKSADTAYATIAKAVSQATDGDTIRVLAGTYNISSTITVNNGVTIKGEGWDKTIVGNGSCRMFELNNDGAKLEGMRLTGATSSDRGAVALIRAGAISWCYICDNSRTGTSYSGGAVSILKGAIDHSIFANNISAAGGAAIGGTTPTGDVVIDTCLIYGNSIEDGQGCGGVAFDGIANNITCMIRNCTIVKNTSIGDVSAGIFLSGSSGGHVVLINNILTGNKRTFNSNTEEVNLYVTWALLDTGASRNCLITGGKASNGTYYRDDLVTEMPTLGFIGSAPNFVDADNSVYRLASDSPAKNAGVTYSGIGKDLANIDFAATPSIGCYEYDGEVPPTPVVATPTFSPTATTFSTTPFNVTLSCATDGATIYYTTDGSDPTESSAEYTAAIQLTATTTVKAKAFKAGCTASAVASATYTYEAPQPTDPAIGSLVITPNGSTAWFSLSGITLGTDSGAVPATLYSVDFAVKNSAGSTIKNGTKLTGQSSSSCFFDVADILDGTYTGYVTITTDKGKTATKDADFTIDTSSEEPTIPLGWTASPMTGSGDIRTDGALIYAYMRGNSNGTFTVNTVPFEGKGSANFADLQKDGVVNVSYGTMYRDKYYQTSDFEGITDPYELMMKCNWRGPEGTPDLVLKNLVPGNTYLVQLVIKATETTGDSQVGVSVASPDGKVAHADGEGWENGGSLVGVFDAFDTSKTFMMTTTVWTALNAIQVRDVSPVETVTPGSSASDTRNKIQAAIDRAAPVHRQVKLSDGLFEIDEQLWVTNGVTLSGCGWENTIIKQTHSLSRVATVDGGSKVEMVTITGGHSSGSDGGEAPKWTHGAGLRILDGTASWCCITNNVHDDMNSYNCFGGGVYIVKGQIDHSIIANNQAGKCSGHGGGIAVGASGASVTGEAIIDTCLIYGNKSPKESGGGVHFNGGSLEIRNSTIVSNTTGGNGNGGGIECVRGSLQMLNSIVTGNLASDVENNISGTLGDGSTGNIIGQDMDLIFVNAENGDYHLGDYSVAYAAGTAYDGIGVDLDNKSFAAPPSIGCYEYAGSGLEPEDTPEETRQTIQDAIDAVAPVHGTVHLGEGVFEIDQQLFVTNGVTLAGQGYEKTIIKQTGTAGTNDATKRCVTMKDGAQLIGLTLTGGNTTDNNAGGAGVYVDSGDATISWCCVTNNTAWFCGGGIGIGKSGSSTAPQHVKIDHTIVADNSSTGGSDFPGAGIGTKAGYLELEVDTCLIYGNHNTSKDGGGIGLKAEASSNYVKSRIVNTTIADNSTAGKGGGIWVENFSKQTVLNETTLINCIFSGNSATGTAEFGDANVGSNDEATYNLMKSKSGCCFFWTGSTAETAFGAFAKTGDVGFVGTGDYRLAANSPAIAAGSTIAADRVDLDNVAFVAPPSVGCYEYESSVPAPKFTPASGTKFQTQLEVKINGQGTVYYTTDGTVPTEGSSTYSSARTISDTTKFMARAYVGGVWSAVASATYVKAAPDAGDYYVSTEGSDFADGLTPETAFKTIERAVEVANDGQKVTILPGTFEIDETIVIDKAITVKGSGWDATTIQPTSGTKIRLFELDGGAKLEGVTLTGGDVRSGACNGAAAWVKNGTISWCCITNNSGNVTTGAPTGSAVTFYNGQGTIDHCIVAKNTGATYCRGAVGADHQTGPVAVDTCLIYGNNCWYCGGVGFSNFADKGVTIQNCTVADNNCSSTSGAGGIFFDNGTGSSAGSCRVTNTIVTGNKINKSTASDLNVSNDSKGAMLVSNCFFGSEPVSGISIVNKKVGEAQFTNAGEGDYHPSAGWEDVIGKGVNYTGIGDTLDGMPFNDPPSIGCYEPSIGFGKVTFAYPAKHVGTATVQLIGLSDGATTANVTFQYGPDSEHLCEPIVVTNGVGINTDIVATMSDLNANCEYAYLFTAVDDKGETTTRSGIFTTDDWDTLQFSTVKANPTSNSADVSVTIMKLGLGATNATVYVQWGTNYNDLCEAVRISTTAQQKQTLTYTIPGLKNYTDYVVRFSGENDVGDTATRDGAFKTLEKEKLALGEPKVSNLGQTTADIAVTVPTLGENAKSATVTLKWWIDGTTDTNSVVMSSAAVRGSSLSQQLTGLTANTLYLYEIVAVNDLPAPDTGTKSVSGGFTTDNPNIGADDYHDSYPTFDDDHVVTYDADSAGNPSTLEPGSPYVVVAKEGYGVSRAAGVKTYWFRNEYDYQYNCSARIGDTYYLFLTDAVAAAQANDKIELLRNNYAISGTMQINRKLTIEGNGYAVKVAAPFLNNTGFVNPSCTATPKTVFKIGTGGDVVINDMLVMGGGEQLSTGGAGSNSANEPAIVVTDTGILEMDHVTVKRSQGGLWIDQQAKVHLNACNLVRNARFCGGGFYSKGVLVMENSSLSENRSLSSGGGGAAAENQGLLVMNNCVICNNGSTEFGGAINNLNNTSSSGIVYMMNMTMAGNFSSYASDYGGGIGLHQSSGDLYMLNCILCNNYHYVTTTGKEAISVSDVYAESGNNNFLYSVYGVMRDKSSYIKDVSTSWQVDAANEDVFKGYSSFTRTYEQNKTTVVTIPGPSFDTAPSNEDARYAPLTENGSKADVDNEGVYTYFDASAWRSAASNKDVSWLEMAYRKEGETTLTALGKCATTADEEDLVTTYYETAFDPTISDRELGVVGASGFGTHKKTYTLYLLENPVNGGVSDNLILTGKSYDQGVEVTVIATPDAKCTFLGWFDAKEATEPVSTKLAYTFVMDSDKSLLARFSEPSETITFYKVMCEQEKGDHDFFQIEITKDWLGKAFPDICPGGEVTTTEVKELVEAELNKPDPANGLNHVWQDYVLGQMLPGDPDGKIWIRGAQYVDVDKLTFNIQEFSETKDCGFRVRYRLAKKNISKDEPEFNREGEYVNNTVGKFNDSLSEDVQYRIIDMIFIPTTAGQSNKKKLDTSFEYVTTVNTAGVMKVNSDKRVEILASPWVGFSPTNNPTIKATDYVKASCLNKDDVLYIYDRAHSNYLAWAVQDGQWAQKDTYQIINGVVYKDDDPADIANTNSLPRGMGAWLERSNTKSPIYLYGQVDPSPVTTTLEPGFNLVGNPYPFEYDASQLPPGVDENDKPCIGMYGDHIVIPTGGAPINSFYQKESWGYYKEIVIDDEFFGPIVTSEWVTEGLTLPIGHGFWYNNTSGKSAELEWSKETK